MDSRQIQELYNKLDNDQEFRKEYSDDLKSNLPLAV